jgi:malonyl-CoA decarboxylase
VPTLRRIKQVDEALRAEFPELKRFSTLSRLPGFRRRLVKRLEGSDPNTTLLVELKRSGWTRRSDESRRKF